MDDLYTLYGATISFYTAKLRSYLIFKKIPFQEVVASNYIFDHCLVPIIGYRMMPILRAPSGELLQDSTATMDWLEGRYPEPSVYPQGPRQRFAALLLEAYAHDWLYIVAMHSRWNFPAENDDFLACEFGKIRVPYAQFEEQITVGRQGFELPRGRLPLAGITDRTKPAIERWTWQLIDTLNEHFGSFDYLLGGRPCTADFALMGSLYGHLSHDPCSSSKICDTAPSVVRWMSRMNRTSQPAGEFLRDDRVPEALDCLLKQAREEYVPAACDVMRKVGEWVEAHPGEPIPRALGEQVVTIAGVRESREAWSHLQYMAQRPLIYYQQCEPSARNEIDALLKKAGAEIDLNYSISHRVMRDNYQLVHDPENTRRFIWSP